MLAERVQKWLDVVLALRRCGSVPMNGGSEEMIVASSTRMETRTSTQGAERIRMMVSTLSRREHCEMASMRQDGNALSRLVSRSFGQEFFQIGSNERNIVESMISEFPSCPVLTKSLGLI